MVLELTQLKINGQYPLGNEIENISISPREEKISFNVSYTRSRYEMRAKIILGIFKCLLLCLYCLNFCVVDVNAKTVDLGSMLDSPHSHKRRVQDSNQNSGLSEFSEDVTESHHRMHRKKKRPNRKRLQEDGDSPQKKKVKKNSDRKKNPRKFVKTINDDITNNGGPLDIIVHIKMNE